MSQRPPVRRSAPIEQENDGIIEGRNAVTEAIRAGVSIDKMYLLKGEGDSALGHIASAAREQGVVVVNTDRRKLDAMSRTHAHQGVIALSSVREYAGVEDIPQAAADKGEYGMTPSDLIEQIPYAIKELVNNEEESESCAG